MVGSSLLALRKKAPPMVSLLELWLKFNPLDAVTPKPVSHQRAIKEVNEL
ncbi:MULTISPECIES: hypothetical protein [unclassified Microcoleus]|nr:MULTISPECIES: hypothetical protein [unclassified Microcoleus]